MLIEVFKKRKKKEPIKQNNRSCASGNQSLHDLGSKERQREGSVGHTSHPLPQYCWSELNVADIQPLPFFFSLNFRSSLFSLVSPSLLPSDSAASPAADLRLLSALAALSHLARCRRHHARHPTGHSSVRSQQDLSLLL